MEAQENKINVNYTLTIKRLKEYIKRIEKLGASENTEICDANYNKIILLEYDVYNDVLLLINE